MDREGALRQFQSRLNDRLQSAREGDIETPAWLAVRSGIERLLLPVSHISEVFHWSEVQAVPHVQPWFMGVTNLRGVLCSVVDLAAFLHGGDSARRDSAALASCRLVSLNPVLDVSCALLVDEVFGMRAVTTFARSDEPEPDSPAFFGHRYIESDGASWQEVDLQALAQGASFLDVRI